MDRPDLAEIEPLPALLRDPRNIPAWGCRLLSAYAIDALLARVRELEAALRKIVNDHPAEECCGRGVPDVNRHNEIVGQQCCGQPTYGFDRAQEIARACPGEHPMSKRASKPRQWRVWVAVDQKTGRFLCGGTARLEVAEYAETYNSPVIHRARLTLDPPQRAPKRKGRK